MPCYKIRKTKLRKRKPYKVLSRKVMTVTRGKKKIDIVIEKRRAKLA